MPEREESVSSAADAPADSGHATERAPRRRDVAAGVAPLRRVSPQDRRPSQSVLPPRKADGSAETESPWHGVLVLAFLASATAGVLVWKPGEAAFRGDRSPRPAAARDDGAGHGDARPGAAPPLPPKPATSSPADVPPPVGR